MPKEINAEAVECLVKEHVKDKSIQALKTDDGWELFATKSASDGLKKIGIAGTRMDSQHIASKNLGQHIFRISIGGERGLMAVLGGTKAFEAAISGIHVIPFPDAVVEAQVAQTFNLAQERLGHHAAQLAARQRMEPPNERG